MSDRNFVAADLQHDTRWKLGAPASLRQDREVLLGWASRQREPLAQYQNGMCELPAVQLLASMLHQELEGGFGFAYVQGMPPFEDDPDTNALLYLAIGAALGEVIETYGRLYEVTDRGGSYRDQQIPVSQTCESTGMHTDSSRLGNVPDYVGLLCLLQGQRGGASKVVSAARVHEALRHRSPRLLTPLYRDFIRDVVTPGSDRDPARIAANRFPVFQYDGRLTLRYMRYWIETGHRSTGTPLRADEIAALDALDEELHREEHLFRLQLAPGEMLWVANRAVAHDRDAYVDEPLRPRLLLRQWIKARG